MLAGLRYPDCRFADRLADGASAANPGELCRLFAMVSIIREELLHRATSILTAGSPTT